MNALWAAFLVMSYPTYEQVICWYLWPCGLGSWMLTQIMVPVHSCLVYWASTADIQYKRSSLAFSWMQIKCALRCHSIPTDYSGACEMEEQNRREQNRTEIRMIWHVLGVCCPFVYNASLLILTSYPVPSLTHMTSCGENDVIFHY